MKYLFFIFLLCIIVLSFTLNIFALNEKKLTFYDEVNNVLMEKMKQASSENERCVYVPYTRIDLAVDNSVEMKRVIQTYRNTKSENAGYNFVMSLLPDTTITHFALWDHGKKLIASIEDRTLAEKAYTEITGDEAPEINIDPGLVRKTGDVFSMRIFPICPGEYKQMELISHRRLGMDDGYFEIIIDVGKVCITRDDDNNLYKSKTCDVSVVISDEIDIKEIILPEKLFYKEKVNDKKWIIRSNIDVDGFRTYIIKYSLDTKEDSITPTFYSKGKDNFFLFRVLANFQYIAEKENKESASDNVFYLAVLRNDNSLINSRFNIGIDNQLNLEIMGFFTLPFYDRSLSFSGCYYNFATEYIGQCFTNDNAKQFLKQIFLKRSVNLNNLNIFGNDNFITYTWEGGAINHLKQFLVDYPDAKYVILFVDRLPQYVLQKLNSIINKNKNINFIFVVKNKNIFNSNYNNVSIYELNKGWVSIKHKPLLKRKILDIFSEMFVDSAIPISSVFSNNLFRFIEKLPNVSSYLPGYEVEGDVELFDVRSYNPMKNDYKLDKNFNIQKCIWLTGKYASSGDTIIKLLFSNLISLFDRSDIRNKTKISKVSKNIFFPDNNGDNLYVGTFSAKHQVDELRTKLYDITNNRRIISGINTKKLTEKEKRLIKNIRNKIVKISKQFSFLSTETAFISLPEELQKKYGFTKQDIIANQMYNLEAMKKGGLPEPHEWILILLTIFIFVLIIYIRRKSQLKNNVS